MRILWNEIKKILTWKVLLLLILINSVLYFFVIEFHIEHFPNGRPALDSYKIATQMVDKYGIDMDEDEILDFKNVYDAEVKKADRYLQSRKEFVEAGIGSYDKFANYSWENEEQSALHDKVFFEEQVDLFFELQERSRLITFHENRKVYPYPSNATAKQKLRYEELNTAKHYRVYTELIIDNFREFISDVAIAILFSVVLVISPAILKDRSRQLLGLQYTAKKGRQLYLTKIAAGMISTFVVITALLIVYFSIYSLNKTSLFFDVPIHTFIGNYAWYNPTFFQYILLCVAAIYVLGFVFGLFAMAFSSIVSSMVALLGIQIPLVAGMLIFGLKPLLSFIIGIWYPQWLVPTSYSVMLIVSVLFVVYLTTREKRRDIVN
ncbi:hypothetical protein [Sporosarcina limicola]|uniref:Uncharacterized protein n=1 Tax=Sporosarcina limicola TaxID=34101 RepID=A0A927MJG3_9BACL|nr:hypothetical protein [Sporosarcina limicola]MBE1554991.1 hypothetical protein [Sporosarcina limicola]